MEFWLVWLCMPSTWNLRSENFRSQTSWSWEGETLSYPYVWSKVPQLMSALVLLRSSLRRRNSFYSLSYFKPNEGINQQFSSFGRPPPWKIRLHESILKQDPSLVFAHENDVDNQNKLRNNVFSSLELTEPEPILGKYKKMSNPLRKRLTQNNIF